MLEGWIKLHRVLRKKPIWKNSTPEQKVLLVTILLEANHEENEWDWGGEKFRAKKGEFVTSAKSLCEAAGKGISRQNVRSALQRFKKMDFLTYKSTKHGMLVSIMNWESYQSKKDKSNQPSNQGVTKDQPSGNHRVTTNKNDKNEKNKRTLKEYDSNEPSLKTEKDEIVSQGAIPKVKEEIEKLVEEFYQEKSFDKIHAFKNKAYKSHNPRAVLHALIRWKIKPDKDPKLAWGYCTNILKVENGLYNEQDYLKA